MNNAFLNPNNLNFDWNIVYGFHQELLHSFQKNAWKLFIEQYLNEYTDVTGVDTLEVNADIPYNIFMSKITKFLVELNKNDFEIKTYYDYDGINGKMFFQLFENGEPDNNTFMKVSLKVDSSKLQYNILISAEIICGSTSYFPFYRSPDIRHLIVFGSPILPTFGQRLPIKIWNDAFEVCFLYIHKKQA